MHPILVSNFPFPPVFWWSQGNPPMLRLPVMCGNSFIGPPVPFHNLLVLQQLYDTISLYLFCIMHDISSMYIRTSTIPFSVHSSLVTTCSLP